MLQAQKLVELEKMVGKEAREEEPGGEDIVGPSGEAKEQSTYNASLQWSNFLAATR